jgi:CubicO group peptidase (beta-lactamase class C family)
LALLVVMQVGLSRALSPPRPASVHALEQTVPELMRKYSVPGVSLALIRGSNICWVKSFGVRDGNEPVTKDTTFEAASLSKVVFAYAVLKLADQAGDLRKA